MKSISLRKGFTLIEILITLAVFAVLFFITTFSFSDINKKQVFQKSVENVLSILNETRSKAMSSQDFSDYGVRLSTSSLVYFKGSDFESGSDKKEYFIDNLVFFGYEISSSSSDFIFKKVTGETEQSGLLTFYLLSDPLNIKNIEIYKSGVSEIK